MDIGILKGILFTLYIPYIIYFLYGSPPCPGGYLMCLLCIYIGHEAEFSLAYSIMCK